MKKLTLKLCSLLLLVLFSVVVLGCNKTEPITMPETITLTINTPTPTPTPEPTKEKTPIAVDDIFDIHTEAQKEYLANDYRYISTYARGIEELSKPKPVTLSWNIEGIVLNSLYNVYISEYEDFSINRKLIANEEHIDIYNLKINTIYYWYAEADGLKSPVKTFKIEANAPRNLNIDGLTNARDLGGYQIGEGKYSNQGLIYRSSRLNENKTTDLLITEAGIYEMLNVLGIKTELDIRRVDNNENGGITTSPLGSSVNYYSVPMKSGGNCILLNKTVLKDAFTVLGNEANYPLVIHCSIGTDRTGMLCFLINALLGVSEEDLYKDYLFSNFGNIGKGRTPSVINDYFITLNTVSGSTLQERAFNYLVEQGVSETDLNNLIRIMTK